MSNMMVNASKYSYLSISKAPFQGRKISRLPYWYASCIMIVSYVFADSQTYILLNSDLSRYINSLYGGMVVPFQARSRYFSRLAVLKLS